MALEIVGGSWSGNGLRYPFRQQRTETHKAISNSIYRSSFTNTDYDGCTMDWITHMAVSSIIYALIYGVVCKVMHQLTLGQAVVLAMLVIGCIIMWGRPRDQQAGKNSAEVRLHKSGEPMRQCERSLVKAMKIVNRDLFSWCPDFFLYLRIELAQQSYPQHSQCR